MSTLRTRLATPADLPAVAALFDDYRQFYEQAPDAARAHDFVQARQARTESLILVAEHDTVAERDPAGLLGFCQLYPSFCSVEAQPIFSLYDLFVTPSARGLGAGRRLLLAAEDLARAHGKARMDLTTARSNITAQRLYESLGWQQDRVFLAYQRRIEPAAAGEAATVLPDDDAGFRALERSRTQALVARDLATAEALHAPDYQLVTPAGKVFDRAGYLGAVAEAPFYAAWDIEAEIALQRSPGLVLMRYPAKLTFPSGRAVHCWHLDAWGLRGGRWQAVWSQATERRVAAV